MGSAQADSTLRRKVDLYRAASQERKILDQRQVVWAVEEVFWFLRLFFSSLSWVCGIQKTHKDNLNYDISDNPITLHSNSTSNSFPLTSHGLSLKMFHPVTIHCKVLLV